MNVLICDDDKNSIILINNLLKDYSLVHDCAFDIYSFINSSDVLIDDKHYDIAFIDVEMPKVNGLELTNFLQKKNPNIVVFIVTSYEGYLDDAMDLNVYRYISKPIDKTRFFTSLNGALKLSRQATDVIVVETGDKVVSLLTIDILFLTIDKRHTIFTTKNGIYVSNKNFEYWKKELEKFNYFAQSHYSYIVNLKHVINFDRTNITLVNGCENINAPISRSFFTLFKTKFYDYMGGTV